MPDSKRAPIPFFDPRFYVLVFNTLRMKWMHRIGGDRRYTEHLKQFYTRSETSHVEAYGDAFADVREIVVNAAEAKPDERILDMATGGGYQAAAFGREGHNVTGMDFVYDRSRLAQEQHGDLANWGVADISRLPYQDDTFDIITISLAMHDMPAELRSNALQELSRVTKRRLVILEPRAPRTFLLRHLYAFIAEMIDESLYIWDFSLHDFESEVRQAGLKILSARRHYHRILKCYILEPHSG